ncbi:MAG: hypothetical protein GY862_04680, partial [Gammaproteobacteria bacterium]|nr:hypothetical protein [Gammaproteobacteria bacterium]
MKAIINNIMRPLLRGAAVWTFSLGCQSAIAVTDSDVPGGGGEPGTDEVRGIEGNIYDAFDNHLFEELSIELRYGGVNGSFNQTLAWVPYLVNCPATNGNCYIQTLDAWEQGYEDLTFGTYVPPNQAVWRDMPLTLLGQPLPLLQGGIVGNDLVITYPSFSPQGRYIRLHHSSFPPGGYLVTDQITEAAQPVYAYDSLLWILHPWQRRGHGQTTLIDYPYQSWFSSLTVCIEHAQITTYYPVFNANLINDNCIGGFGYAEGQGPEEPVEDTIS